MEYQDKSQRSATVQDAGEVTRKVLTNNRIARVRKAREKHNRQHGSPGADGKQYMIICSVLCAAIAMVLTVEKAGEVSAASGAATLIEVFPQGTQGLPAGSAEPGASRAPDASQLSGPPGGSGTSQASGAPGTPQSSGTSGGSGTQQAFGTSGASGTPQGSGTSGGSGAQQAFGPPEASGTTQVSGPPGGSGTYQLSGAPRASGTPQLSGPPQAPVSVQASGVSRDAGADQAADADAARGQERPADAALHPEPVYTLLDTFEITGYCSCDKCCGVKEVKLTKSETVPRSSHTVAVDPEVIPLGTRIMIDGVIYCAEDIGKAIRGKIVDIYFDSHEEALEFGRQKKKVYLVE